MNYLSKKRMLELLEGPHSLFDAWVPYNIPDRGNGSLLYLRDGTVQPVDIPASNMVRILEKRYGVDGQVRKTAYFECTGKTQNYPVRVAGQLFFAFQFRDKPICKHDGTMAFCDAHQVKKLFERSAGGTSILLKSGQHIDSVWSINSIRDCVNRAHGFEHQLYSQGII